jgi:G3E family GTPase
MVDYETLIPVNVITGFLGSGKTTLLQRLLASPRLSNTAVLINEFGEVALDHLLLERLDEETIVLQGGCVCCTIRSDLTEAIRDLYGKRERGEVPPFERLAIETTGLADPAPVVFTFMADPVIRHHFRLGNTIATIDAVNGPLHLDRNPESVKQVLVADRLALTKTDLCDDARVRDITDRLERLNPAAPIIETAGGGFDPDDLLMSDIYDAERKVDEIRRWLAPSPGAGGHDDHGTGVSRHDGHIHAFCLTYDEPVDWTAFGIWLTMLLHRHGEKVLRVKGILNVLGLSAPVAIHGVQHVVHPPAHMGRWPDDDRRSRIVFIVRDLRQRDLERSLAAFNRLGDSERGAA